MVTLLLTEQLTVLFLMMGCGFVLVKTKIVKSRDSKTLSLISVYLIMPCVIINAFQIDYSKEIQDGFLLALFAAVILHLLLFLICGILGKFLNLTSVEKASLIYSNAGNLIIPLVTSVLGSEWVIYSRSRLESIVYFQTDLLNDSIKNACSATYYGRLYAASCASLLPRKCIYNTVNQPACNDHSICDNHYTNGTDL